MADGLSLGEALLDLGADLAPLARDLQAAKVQVARETAEMQAILDTLHLGEVRGGLGDNVAAWADEQDAALATVRHGLSETAGGWGELAAAAVASSEVQVAAAHRVTRAFEEQAVAARVAAAAGGLGIPAAGGERVVVAGAPEAASTHGVSGIWGVRGPSAPGSVANPVVMVMEAANRTPLGSLAAAIGENSGDAGPEATTVTQGNETKVIATPGAESGPAGGAVRDVVVADEGSRASSSPLVQEVALAAAVEKLAQAAGGTHTSGIGDSAAVTAALQDLAAKGVGPGQRAKQGEPYQRAYELLGYTVASRTGGGPTRLYAPGGEPGTGNYGLTREAAEVAALREAAGGRGGGGGIPPLIASLLFGHGGGGGGGGYKGAGTGLIGHALFGAAGLGAGVGSIGSFAGFGAEHIILTLGGIAGSGVAALGGGSLLAAGALGKFAAGAGSDLAVSSSAIADTHTLFTSYEKLREAVAQYGKASSQAKEAQAELNATMKFTLSGTKGVAAELQLAEKVSALNVQWDKQTSGARVAFVHLAEPLIEIGSKWIPQINRAAEQNFIQTRRSLTPFFAWLQGPEAIGIFNQLEREFRLEIPAAMGAFSQGFEFFAKTIAYLAPMTGSFVRDLDTFFTKWNQPSEFAVWEGEMGKLISDFHAWGAFVKELGGALVDLFDKDAKTGKSIIEWLTQALHKVREYENSVNGSEAIRNLFVVHKEEVLALLGALVPLLSSFTHIYTTVAPPLVKAVTEIARAFTSVVEAVEKAGALGTWAVGLTLIAAKLKVLMPLLAAAKGEFFGVASGETAAAAGGTELAAAGGATGLRIAAGSATGGLTTAETEDAGTAGLLSKGTLIKGGVVGVAGLVGGSLLASATGAHGTTAQALQAGGAGAGLGYVAGGAISGSILGTEITPVIGTAIGAVLGAATPLAIHFLDEVFSEHAPDYGKKFATGFTSSFAPLLGSSLTKSSGEAVDKVINELHKARKEYESATASKYNPYGEETTPAEKAAAATKRFNAEYTQGATFGHTVESAERGIQHPSAGALGRIDLHELLPLGPGEAQDLSAELLLNFAKGLEAHKQIPAGAFKKVLDLLEAQIPGLGKYLAEHGEEVDQKLSKGLALKQSEAMLHHSLDNLIAEFGLLIANPNATGKQLVHEWESALRQLEVAVKEHVPGAAEALKKFGEEGSHVFYELAQKTKGELHTVENAVSKLGKNLPELGAPGFAKYEGLVTKMLETVTNGVGLTAREVESGIRAINKGLETELKTLGAPKEVVTPLITGKGGVNLRESPFGGASGALLQIGRPGEGGHDTVPMSVGGQGIMVAPGEQVAVFNRYQLPEVNAALAERGYEGGLSGLFGAIKTPNYMASGGALPAITSAATHDVKAAAAKYLASHKPHGGGGRGTPGKASHASEPYLEHLWTAAGGPPGLAHLAAAIAMAESGGDPNSVNPEGPEHAEGLWQIKGQLVPGNILNPMVNARNAVAKWREAGGFSPWTTYTSGAYRAFYALGGLLPGFAGGGLPKVVGGHPQKVSKSFGHGQHKQKTKVEKPKHYGGPLTLPWNPAQNKQLSLFGTLVEHNLPALAETYSGLINEYSISPYGQGSLAFVITEGPYGEQVSPYEDLANVEARLGQLHALSHAEAEYKKELETTQTVGNELAAWLAVEIKAHHKRIYELQERINAIRARIEANLKKIRELNKRASDLEHGKGSKKGAGAGLRKQVSALEAENKTLGGSNTSIGAGGKLGPLEKQRGTLQNQLDLLGERGVKVTENLKDVHGIGGHGGELAEATVALAGLAKEETELGAPALAAALTRASVQAGGGTSTANEELVSLLKEKDQELALENAVLKAQYSVLAKLPPYGGSFGEGGIVPGPMGSPKVVIAHGGEGIGSPTQVKVDVHTHVLDGAVDKNKIRQVVRQEQREMARNVGRPLPSRGGFQLGLGSPTG